jgi:hypothetical protein
MRIIGLLMRIRRVLVGLGRMLMDGLVIVLPMMFRSGAMGLCRVFVVLCSFRMGFLGHYIRFSWRPTPGVNEGA